MCLLYGQCTIYLTIHSLLLSAGDFYKIVSTSQSLLYLSPKPCCELKSAIIATLQVRNLATERLRVRFSNVLRHLKMQLGTYQDFQKCLKRLGTYISLKRRFRHLDTLKISP